MSSAKLILFGFLRHTIGALGVWFVARGYLTPEQQMSWTATAVQEVFGALMLGAAYLWSALDKKRMVEWFLAFLRVHPNTAPAVAAARVSSLLAPIGGTHG